MAKLAGLLLYSIYTCMSSYCYIFFLFLILHVCNKAQGCEILQLCSVVEIFLQLVDTVRIFIRLDLVSKVFPLLRDNPFELLQNACSTRRYFLHRMRIRRKNHDVYSTGA